MFIQIEQGNQLYIAIIQIQLYLVELIEIIEIDDSYFEISNYNLLYFSNKEFRKQELGQLLIKVEIQSIARNKLFSNHLVPLNFTKMDLVNLNLIIENKCVQLFAINNSSYIVLKQKQPLQIDISEYFYGPISNLTLVSNSSFRLTGPLQFNTQIKECSLYTSTFCLKQFLIKNQKSQSQILTFMFTAIIFENLSFEIVEFDNTFLQILQIKKGYLLGFSLLENNLQIQLMQFFEDIQEYCIIQQFVTQDFKVETTNKIDIKRSGNLVQIKNQINFYYIFIQDINFSQISILGNLIDYLYIEQSQDQYLFLQHNNQIDLELRIYQVNFRRIQLIYSQNLTEQLQTSLNQYGTFSYKGQIIQLQDCTQIAEQINVRFLMIDSHYSFILALQINKKNHFIQITILKQIRNLIIIDLQYYENTIFYRDESILILNQQFEHPFIFYDLRENREFYDSIYSFKASIRIKKLNTTHYVFINNSDVFLGKIGYEIDFQSYEDLDYDIILIAQNDVSQQQISLTIHFDQQNFIFQCNLILIIQVIALIFIIFYLRVKKSHRKGLESFKITQQER